MLAQAPTSHMAVDQLLGTLRHAALCMSVAPVSSTNVCAVSSRLTAARTRCRSSARRDYLRVAFTPDELAAVATNNVQQDVGFNFNIREAMDIASAISCGVPHGPHLIPRHALRPVYDFDPITPRPSLGTTDDAPGVRSHMLTLRVVAP
ncbi:hypothetical protein SPRG_13051 [Saprolegnia parasitica CBS 223.65]|uniref:Uncharacterized protein n=1 Tax=Saprolegnia parasitica (strain CBS 223.65) TaxID=695850 RepID=A0A067BSY6_SAPPC|nr:hypothetical protein SPRG_13051 [Saprolegnia parasitica CBS 223.65]KDO19945.1 hypothetical protein SPRG_13051 [Saprolegnia parasitica CBS 223.65]|eukprot:XP_012209317.1 hypothetical protein SPRG_13051 [Saprolegnia parasitica CBS 223.65]